MNVYSDALAADLSLVHKGSSKKVSTIASILNQNEHTLVWAAKAAFGSRVKKGILLMSSAEFEEIVQHPQVTYLITSQSPRLVFAQIFNNHFLHLKPDYFENHVDMHRLNKGIRIGEHVFIGKDVHLGDGCEIQHNSIIFGGTRMGKRCKIGSGVIIGSTGLGFEYLGNTMVEFPQIGNVVIGDDVWIGDNTSIRRASLDSTIIGDACKIGSSCNIGHNCSIGALSILTSHICMGGSSAIGDSCFIGMNASIRNKVQLGNSVTVGMAAAVISNFPDNTKIAGVPAQVLGTPGN